MLILYQNGEYILECPQDSYKIGVKADGYEVFETDDFVNVVYGEETIFNITLKKEIITTEPTANYEKLYYDFIEDELTPKYGLSNLSGFESINWTFKPNPVVNEIPTKTQGIIGAYIYDFDKNGYDECLIIRQNEHDYILDCYNYELNCIGSYTICSFNSKFYVSLQIFILSEKIVIEYSTANIPGLLRYGTHTIVLNVSDSGFNESIKTGGSRDPGGEILYINDTQFSCSEYDSDDKKINYDSVEKLISEELLAIGIIPENVIAGWYDPNGAVYGVKVILSNEAVMLFKDIYNNDDNLTYFKDYTNLRDHLTNTGNNNTSKN